jgi:hypothetical protein
MYVFAQQGILSIVAHRTKPGMLMVRSVAREDVAAFWPEARIIEMDDADYRFRTTLPRDEVAARITQAVQEINYDRVKPIAGKGRSHTFFQVWDTMMALQEASQ